VNALCRYQLADFVRSQRWVPPLLVYLIVLGLVYSLDAGPAVPAYGATAVALFPIVAWLTRMMLSAEDPVAREITAATARGQLRGQAALLVSAGVATLPFVVLSIGWAGVANHHNIHGWHAWLGGVGIHLVFVLLGVGLGALLAPPILNRPGPAVLGIVAVSLLSVIIRVSPVAGALDVLTRNPRQGFTAAIAAPVTVLCGLAAVAILASLATARRS
jgi:hypothetical protein